MFSNSVFFFTEIEGHIILSIKMVMKKIKKKSVSQRYVVASGTSTLSAF